MLLKAASVAIVSGCTGQPDADAPDADLLSIKATAASAREAAVALTDPTTQLGVRVRKYNGYFNRSNASDAAIWENLEGAVALVNAQRAAQRAGATISVAELVTNLLAEGALLMLEQSAQ